MKSFEYIWIDGGDPTKKLRSKTRIGKRSAVFSEPNGSLVEYPECWHFDGSSTGQASTEDSDCELRPVRVVADPIRSNGWLVLCEVFYHDDPHSTNTRVLLRDTLSGVSTAAPILTATPIFGFEQEYTLMKEGRPLGFPVGGGYPEPQGPYYCGVGSDEVHGRELVERHLDACLRAGLRIGGINSEVMPGQWEFQIGPDDPLTAADHLWIARWLLYRLGEDVGITATLCPKPMDGDWNGAGLHAHYSNAAMRRGDPGSRELFCETAESTHTEYLGVCGAGNKERLTGSHETSRWSRFKWGEADRAASIRLPREGDRIEDRRPGANADPYEIAAGLLRIEMKTSPE